LKKRAFLSLLSLSILAGGLQASPIFTLGPGGPDPVFAAAVDAVFDFTDIGPGVASSGTLNAASNGDGTFTAISGSGTFNGIAITLIPDPTPPAQVTSPSGHFLYEDQLLPADDPLILNGGLLFSLASGPIELNIFSNSADNYQTLTDNGVDAVTTFALVASVPEPSTGMIVLGGILLLNLMRKTRPRQR